MLIKQFADKNVTKNLRSAKTNGERGIINHLFEAVVLLYETLAFCDYLC